MRDLRDHLAAQMRAVGRRTPWGRNDRRRLCRMLQTCHGSLSSERAELAQVHFGPETFAPPAPVKLSPSAERRVRRFGADSSRACRACRPPVPLTGEVAVEKRAFRRRGLKRR